MLLLVGNPGAIFCYAIAIHSGNLFIVFVQIIYNMQHIVKPVKAVTKKYTTKNGVKESISKRVDFGVTDLFDVDDLVAITLKTNFDKLTTDSADAVGDLEKTIADKDATITGLNESNDKLNKELQQKLDKLNEVTAKLKAAEKTIAELESDISAKDKTIAELTSTVDDNAKTITASGNVIDDLNVKVDELTATVGELKPLLLSKDETISDLEKQIAIYDAVDVDKLKEKADELDKSKNVIILQQKQITEYLLLVNFHKDKANAYKNQNAISKLIGRDAAADITLPDLALIDSSGNPIADDNADSGNGSAKQ